MGKSKKSGNLRGSQLPRSGIDCPGGLPVRLETAPGTWIFERPDGQLYLAAKIVGWKPRRAAYPPVDM